MWPVRCQTAKPTAQAAGLLFTSCVAESRRCRLLEARLSIKIALAWRQQPDIPLAFCPGVGRALATVVTVPKTTHKPWVLPSCSCSTMPNCCSRKEADNAEYAFVRSAASRTVHSHDHTSNHILSRHHDSKSTNSIQTSSLLCSILASL